ncbi:hypothetical protein JCM11641_004288 [Rhodosporidiobolus odoratus]
MACLAITSRLSIAADSFSHVQAGANAKRVSASNAKTLQQLQLGFLVSGGIYLLHLFIFSSGRSFRRLFLFVLTETIAVSLWRWMQAMAKRGEEVTGSKAVVAYMFDVIYVTWFVHIATALISGHFWKVYWIIPLYALYRLALFLLPRFAPGLAALLPGFDPSVIAAPTTAGPVPANQPQPTSKRQEKLRKRAEKGDRRVQYKETTQPQAR